MIIKNRVISTDTAPLVIAEIGILAAIWNKKNG